MNLPCVCVCETPFYLSRSEQFFGSPSDIASSAENIRDKLKLVEDKRLQEESERHLEEETALEEGTEES